MDQNGFTAGFFIALNFCFGAHDNTAAASAISLHNACTAIDDGARREIWPRDKFHQFIDGDIRVIDQFEAALYNFF